MVKAKPIQWIRYGVSGMALAALLGGCGLTRIDADYSPSSSLSVHGAAQIGTFEYRPTDGKLKPNQLRNRAFAEVYLDKNVDVFIRESLLKELRFVGVKIGSGAVVSGEIKDFLDDDADGNVMSLDVHYVVKNAAGNVLYDGEKTSKAPSTFGTGNRLDRVLKENFEALIADPAFIKAIN